MAADAVLWTMTWVLRMRAHTDRNSTEGARNFKRSPNRGGHASIRAMFRLLTLLLLALPLATPVFAAEHVSDRHRFAITLPDSESWMRGNVQQLGREAEIVFSYVNMNSREGILVAVAPKIPTDNVMNEKVIGRVIELLTLQGFSVLGRAPRIVNNVEYLEVIGSRTDETNAKIISVSRAIIRNHALYIATFFGRGNEDRALDSSFARIIDTFRFLDAPQITSSPFADPMHGYYRTSYIACLGAAGALALLFGFVLFRTRRRGNY